PHLACAPHFHFLCASHLHHLDLHSVPTRRSSDLDSGDLAYLSKKARKMLDEAGFTDAIISASSDLDEYLIDSLRTQGAAITSWGDRKSTRLNSSHVSISYAVFCLKKKTYTHNDQN